jgi:glycosyltransferase involved in cell wall biosynthesis
MKILFDHQCFTIQNYGGISRYFTGLIEEFSIDSDINTSLALKYSNNFYLRNKKYFNGKSFLATHNFKGQKSVLHLLNKTNSISQIKTNRFDLLHPTYYNPYFVQTIDKRPFVITVFDMIHEIFPDSIHWFDKTASQKKYLIPRATKIIAISKNTKKDLVERLNVPPEKVEVIYLATHITKEIALTKEKLRLPERYILYVGGRNYYKNFRNILLAFKNITKTDDTICLVCSGGGTFNDAEKELFINYGLTNKLLYRNADDTTLATLYSNALLFVFPSLYEGFGIPVIEAMNCDCPMALSNISSLPEIGAEAAIYFNPNDIIDMQNQIAKIIYDDTLRNKLIENGKIRRKDFSWAKTANETKNFYMHSL